MKHILERLGHRSISAIRINHVSRFGEVSKKLLNMIELAIQKLDHIPPTSILFGVVDADISALAGLDVLDSNCFIADNISNSFCHFILISDDSLEIFNK